MAELSVLICLAHRLGDAEAVRDRDLRDLRVGVREDLHAPVAEVLHGLFPDGKDRVVMSLYLFFRKFEQVGIVTARQAPVAGDDDVEPFFTGSRLCKKRLEVSVLVGDLGQGGLHGAQIGLAGHGLVLGLAELGRGDQLHGLGDLHGVLDTLDPQLDCLHISSCHSVYLLCSVSAGPLRVRAETPVQARLPCVAFFDSMKLWVKPSRTDLSLSSSPLSMAPVSRIAFMTAMASGSCSRRLPSCS